MAISCNNVYNPHWYFSISQITSLKIKHNPFAKAFQDSKERFSVDRKSLSGACDVVKSVNEQDAQSEFEYYKVVYLSPGLKTGSGLSNMEVGLESHRCSVCVKLCVIMYKV